MSSDSFRELYTEAKAARERSYSPYSGYKVGAALRTSSGKIFSGCNIENSSYGATVCAERVAIQKAVSEEGEIKITELVVITDVSPPWPPCGVCRQVISEFADKKLVIHTANLSKETKSTAFSDLFPSAFTPAHLGKGQR
ncbi:MAG: cytidine deaminase [Bdellovibrionota bacterium]